MTVGETPLDAGEVVIYRSTKHGVIFAKQTVFPVPLLLVGTILDIWLFSTLGFAFLLAVSLLVAYAEFSKAEYILTDKEAVEISLFDWVKSKSNASHSGKEDHA